MITVWHGVLLVAGVGLGLMQLWLAIRSSRPSNLRRVSLWASLALLSLAGWAGCRLAYVDPGLPRALLISTIAFGALWLIQVWELSKQNTTM